MGIIDEVKQKTDIVEIVGQFTKLTKAGKNLKGLCPFHSEKHGSFFIYPEQQTWHCFGACNDGGDVFSFIMKQQNVGFGDALRLLAEKAGIQVPSAIDNKEDREIYEKLYQINQAAAQYFHNILINTAYGEKAKIYTLKRGLSEKTITDFQLGYSLSNMDSLKLYLMEKGYTDSELIEAGVLTKRDYSNSHDIFRKRLMIPIQDIKGRFCGFGARTFEENQPKYINSPQTPVFDKSGNLYGINLASQAIRQQDRAILVEGYMDVIIAHQYGFLNVVASMGTAITDKQMTILKKLTKNLVLALDSDTAGEEAMLRCVSYENLIGNEIKVAILPAGSDPDDVIRQDTNAWKDIIEKAVPVIDYTFDMIMTKLDLSLPKDKTTAVEKLKPVINGIDDKIRKAHYVQKLSRLVMVSDRDLIDTIKQTTAYNIYGKKKDKEITPVSIRNVFSQPLEEYCLSLLLKFPRLKAFKSKLKPEYFVNSENREIFMAIANIDDVNLIKNSLDYTIWGYVDNLINKEMPSAKIEEKMSICTLRLHEKFLKSLEMKRELIFAAEATAKGSKAELNKLEEQGIEGSTQLREVFSKKSTEGLYRGDVNEARQQKK